MAKWSSSKKHLPSEINSGNQYEIKDRLVLEQLNAITENSFYASEKVDTVISDAQDVVTQGKNEIKSLTNEGKTQIQALTNQGKTEIKQVTAESKTDLINIVDDAEDLVAKANASIDTVVGTANEALFTVQQVVASKGYYGSNPNLLVNGDFKINQRGQSLYERTGGRIYIVDGWNIWSNNGSYDVETKTLTNKVTAGNVIMSQWIRDYENYYGKTLTISGKINGEIHYATTTLPTTFSDLTGDKALGIYEHKVSGVTIYYIRIAWDNTYKRLRAEVGCTPSQGSIVVEWMKLEVGTIATAFSPRPYEEELAICQNIVEGLATTYSNPNLLINGDFTINQRGQPNYGGVNQTVGKGYTVDRWHSNLTYLKFDVASKTLTNNDTTYWGYFRQYIENQEALYGKDVTFSSLVNGVRYFISTSIPTNDTSTSTLVWTAVKNENNEELCHLEIGFTANKLNVRYAMPMGKSITIDEAKLEIGNVATTFSPRPYAEELTMCQRYFQKIRVNGAMSFIANVNVLYAGVPLVQTMRATPTVTNEVQTSVREIGKGIKGNVDLVFNYLYDNILQVSADTSSLGLTLYSGCVLANGTLALDAEIYDAK